MSSPLPTIRTRDLLPGNADRRLEACNRLHEAARDYGFFYLELPPELLIQASELERLARDFFALPQDQKDALALANQDNGRGYARLNENVTNGLADNHEGIDFYRPVEVPDKSKPLWGENQWPRMVPDFREKYEIWVEEMKKLGMIVMEAMSVGLGMSTEEWQLLRSQVDRSFWVMRVIGYPPLPNDHEGYSCGAHKDYGCLTFLLTDATKSALQVYLRNKSLVPERAIINGLPHGSKDNGDSDGVWIEANPIEGCVVCNIGEMWEIWTRGIYRSTLHRVIHKGANYRVSIPFFFEPNFDAVISPLAAADRLLEEHDHEKQWSESYQPVVYGQFLLKKVTNNFYTSPWYLRSRHHRLQSYNRLDCSKQY